MFLLRIHDLLTGLLPILLSTRNRELLENLTGYEKKETGYPRTGVVVPSLEIAIESSV